ncbi:hematopoietic cell signal transducer-like [Crotalus adamanteus]|uniref:Hematopoietic cell signal transducer-like n=1 Tax=Crotalus adamanteus TaxID=8729 RepID=A0AAW1AXZ0_CROAD
MWSFAVSIFCLLTGFTVAEGPGNYGDCYHINIGIMIGIVAGDLLLTLLLLLPVYCCIHRKGLEKKKKKKKKDEPRNYVNMIGVQK